MRFRKKSRAHQELLPSFFPTAPTPLTSEDKRAMLGPTPRTPNRTRFDAMACDHCGGVHPLACPKVKRLVRRGQHTEVEFWPWGEWPVGLVVFRESLYMEEDEEETP